MKFSKQNRHTLTIAKRNNYYAFSYEILRNKFALAFAYSTEKKRARERAGTGEGRGHSRMQTPALYVSTPPLSSPKSVF